MIDTLAPLSNNVLIVPTLDFLFSSKVVGLIQELVEILLHSFGGKITPKVIGDKSIELIDCSIFEFNFLLGWHMRQDLIDMWFKLVLINGSK